MQTAIFAAGCFWGVEKAFRSVKGVVKTEAGYCGGTVADPSYKEVCTGKTGHAEAVRVKFDSRMVSFAQLLELFWEIHDPTLLNRQGPDVGSQYRSAIFCQGEQQRQQAEKLKTLRALDSSAPIVTEIIDAGDFFLAEPYHQQYYDKKMARYQ